MRNLFISLLLTACLPLTGANLVDLDFEESTVGKRPSGWTPFLEGTQPDVTGHETQNGEKCLMGRRSSSGSLTSLSRSLPKPADRVLIQFDFAVSSGSGRSLNVWSHEPNGKDASQFNLAVIDGTLRQFDGRTRSWEVVSSSIKPSPSPARPVWHRLRVIVDSQSDGIDFWLSRPGEEKLPSNPTATMAAYRTRLPIGSIDLVSGTRLEKDAWYLIDNLIVTTGSHIPPPGKPEPLAQPFALWEGEPIPDPSAIPFVEGARHSTLHQAKADGYKFLHGAAIIEHQGTLFANWANSLVDENSPTETLQGRRSRDGGKTWSGLEVIAPGFEDKERHSHGVLMKHRGQLWTFAARFGKGIKGRRFDGLHAEAFQLQPNDRTWRSMGPVMTNCWPYDEPIRMGNGDFITGGQDKDGLPVVAYSHGDDLLHWETVAIPYPKRLSPSFAETSVIDVGEAILAVIRGGRGTAWVSISRDHGRTWSIATESNLPMPRAKPYLGRLSTGQFYLLSNLKNRDTLVISASKPGGTTLKKMWRIRHGRSEAPRFKGFAKSPQWSYPYAHEWNGNLYVVYSIGKEDCGLSILPIQALKVE